MMTQITNLKSVDVTIEHLQELLNKELTFIDPAYCCTIRGLSRLLSISSPSLTDKRLTKSTGKPQGILSRIAVCKGDELPDSLKPIAGFDFRTLQYNSNTNIGTALLPDTVISCIIKYYAYDARTTLHRAKQLDALFTSIGIRVLFKQVASNIDTAIEQKPTGYRPHHAEPLPGVVPDIEDILVHESPADKILRLFQKLESARLTTTQINNFIRHNLLVDDETVNTSYRGVQKHKNRYRAFISVNGASRMIGSYETAEEAAHAYDAYAVIVHGEKARLNF